MYKYLFECLFIILYVMHLGMELLHHMIILCLTCEELLNCFSQPLHPFASLPVTYEGCNFSIISLKRLILSFVHNSHLSRCVIFLKSVISLFSFIFLCHFLPYFQLFLSNFFLNGNTIRQFTGSISFL